MNEEYKMIFLLMLLILTPGLISLLIHRGLIHKNNKALEIITIYSVYSFCIFLVISIISHFINPNDNLLLSITNNTDLFRALFSIKFMFLALNASVILPIIIYLAKTANWFLKKSTLLNTQESPNFIVNEYSKQINEFVFGTADFYLNLSADEILDLVLFINSAVLQKKKIRLFSPDHSLKLNVAHPEIEIVSREAISKADLADNEVLLVIGNQTQEDNLEKIAPNMQSRVFRLTFDDKKLGKEGSNLLVMSSNFNEMNQNTEYIKEFLLQSLLDYVFTLVE